MRVVPARDDVQEHDDGRRAAAVESFLTGAPRLVMRPRVRGWLRVLPRATRSSSPVTCVNAIDAVGAARVPASQPDRSPSPGFPIDRHCRSRSGAVGYLRNGTISQVWVPQRGPVRDALQFVPEGERPGSTTGSRFLRFASWDRGSGGPPRSVLFVDEQSSRRRRPAGFLRLPQCLGGGALGRRSLGAVLVVRLRAPNRSGPFALARRRGASRGARKLNSQSR